MGSSSINLSVLSGLFLFEDSTNPEIKRAVKIAVNVALLSFMLLMSWMGGVFARIC